MLHHSMVAFDNILREKHYEQFARYENQYVLLRKILIPSEKPVYAPVYSLFEIPSTENYFKQFVAKSLEPNCKEDYLELII